MISNYRVLLGFFPLVLAACETADQQWVSSESSIVCRGCSDLYIVAHEDDDLLFMNPDIRNSIRLGNTVRTVFLTAGDASNPNPAYWQGRERGILKAYAQMAGITYSASAWSSGTDTINGRLLQSRYLLGTSVSVTFLRLADPTNSDPDLRFLWETPAAAPNSRSLTSVDGLNTYTRSQLIDTLHQIMVFTAAQRVSTLDSSNTHTRTHSDHYHSALFALTAHEKYTPTHSLSIYRDYSEEDYRVNLHADETATNWAAFEAYSPEDMGSQGPCPSANGYCIWSQGQYTFSADGDGSSVIGIADGRCLSINGPAAFNGATLQLGACNVSNALRFTTDNYTIRASGYCATASGANAVLTPCNNSAAQRFTLMNNGQIRAPDAKCLESSSGNVLNIVSCSAAQPQRWSMQPRDAGYFSVTNQFANADGLDPWYSQTFRLGDLNGDGRADACMRKSDGVYCAIAAAGGFGGYTRWTTEFSDAFGWQNDHHGTTLQLGDVNGDGRADVCGRGGAGMICANSTGTTFGPPSVRTSAHNNASGWAANAAYYRSIRLADVNDDGIDDVCGRGGAGIYCSLGQSSGNFGAMTLWISSEFSDARGWLTNSTGTTIQFGDIDADGKADVCGRLTGGIVCAQSTGSSFVRPHYWSFQNDFADAAGWAPETHSQSVRLGDIDGDGAADVCARGTGGIWCASSNGNTNFAPMRLFMPRDFGDAQSWNPVYHGATIALGDLDADGRADVCGRGGARLICAVR